MLLDFFLRIKKDSDLTAVKYSDATLNEFKVLDIPWDDNRVLTADIQEY